MKGVEAKLCDAFIDHFSGDPSIPETDGATLKVLRAIKISKMLALFYYLGNLELNRCNHCRKIKDTYKFVCREDNPKLEIIGKPKRYSDLGNRAVYCSNCGSIEWRGGYL